MMIGVIGLLLLVSCAFFTYEARQTNQDFIEKRADYESLEAEFRQLSIEEGMKKARETTKELDFFSLLLDEAYIGGLGEIWKEDLDKQKRENPDAVKRYNESEYIKDEELLYHDSFLYGEIDGQYASIRAHQKYVNEMAEKSEDLLSVSIFHKENSFSYRNIQKTVKDFKSLQTIEYQLGQEYGLVSATNFTPTDLSMIAILFMLAFYLFHHEREAGLLGLIRSTPKGRITTVTVKLGVMGLLTLLLSLLFYGSLLLIASKMYGFGDLSRMIQSMSSFKNGDVPLTVKQFLLSYVILKSFACLLIGLLIALLFIVFRRASPVFLVAMVCVGVSFLFYKQIHPGSFANGIKYLNFVAFFDTFQMLVDYRNINILGYPVSKLPLSIITGSIVMILFLLLICMAYTREWSLRLPLVQIFQRWINRIRHWHFNRRRFNTLFQHEWYKLFISSRGWIVLMLGVILSVQMLQAPERSFTLKEANYHQYMMQLAGPLDEENRQFMENEAQRFEELGLERQKGEEAFLSGQLSEGEYIEKQAEWNIFEKRDEAFNLVEEQYSYLLSVEHQTAFDVGFVNQMTSDQLFNQRSEDVVLALLFLALVGVMFSSIFTQDYQNQANTLLRATAFGRWRLFRTKLGIAYILVFTILAFVYIPKYIILLQNYPIIDWSLPIQSIELFPELPWSVTIKQFFILTSVWQVVGCLVIVHISQLLSILVRKHALSLLLQSAVLIVPLVVTYIGFNHLILYTFNGVFLAPYVLNTENATLIALCYMGGIIFLGAGAFVLSWKLYNAPKVRKG